MKILVCIPCYQCAGQVRRVLDGFTPQLREKLHSVILIDNGSRDGTPEVALEWIEREPPGLFEVWQNRKNLGLGGTHKVAFLAAEEQGCDYVGILHGDNQARSEELLDLIEYAEHHRESSAVLGARFMARSKRNGYSRLRTIGNQLLNVLYTTVTGRKTCDLGSGINLFRMKDFPHREFLGFQDDFTFNIDLLLHYFRRRLNICFLPITWTETDQQSNAKTFQVGWSALIKLIRWFFHKELRMEVADEKYGSKRLFSEVTN